LCDYFFIVGTHYKKNFLVKVLFGREGTLHCYGRRDERDDDEKWDVMKLLVGFVLQHPSFKGICGIWSSKTHTPPPNQQQFKSQKISYIIWSYIVGPMQFGTLVPQYKAHGLV
jgi:hypothetical protein